MTKKDIIKLSRDGKVAAEISEHISEYNKIIDELVESLAECIETVKGSSLARWKCCKMMKNTYRLLSGNTDRMYEYNETLAGIAGRMRRNALWLSVAKAKEDDGSSVKAQTDEDINQLTFIIAASVMDIYLSGVDILQCSEQMSSDAIRCSFRHFGQPEDAIRRPPKNMNGREVRTVVRACSEKMDIATIQFQNCMSNITKCLSTMVHSFES